MQLFLAFGSSTNACLQNFSTAKKNRLRSFCNCTNPLCQSQRIKTPPKSRIHDPIPRIGVQGKVPFLGHIWILRKSQQKHQLLHHCFVKRLQSKASDGCRYDSARRASCISFLQFRSGKWKFPAYRNGGRCSLRCTVRRRIQTPLKLGERKKDVKVWKKVPIKTAGLVTNKNEANLGKYTILWETNYTRFCFLFFWKVSKSLVSGMYCNWLVY